MSRSIVLLPGLGADRRLFAPQIEGVPGVDVMEWPAPAPDDTLATFAERIATGVTMTPAMIGGASFGGFIAWEMARHLRPQKLPQTLCLIGSASSLRALRTPLRASLPLASLSSATMMSAVKAGGSIAARIFGAKTAAQRAVFVDMMRATPSPFMAWAVRAIAAWQPSALPEGTRVVRIHGARDRIIAPPDDAESRTSAACEIVADAGHLLTLSHAPEVNRFLLRCRE